MAFDGIVIASLVHEFNQTIAGGKIAKIAQPEKDELLFTIKNNRENYRLLLSVNPSLPLAYLTDKNTLETEKLFPSPSQVWSGRWSLKSSIWTRWEISAGNG